MGKEIGHLGLFVQMLKAIGEPYLKSLTDVFREILFEGKFPVERMLSSLVPVFKRKVDSLSPNHYRRIKFLEYAFKVWKDLEWSCMNWWILTRWNTDLNQVKRLWMQCLFWEDLLKKWNLKKIFVCGSWKEFQSSLKWSYYFCFEVEGIC